MNKFFISGLCASILVGLGACASTSVPNCPYQASDMTHNTAALKSGIYFNYFDKSIRPQDDIYNYVNGGWIKQTTIPSDRTRSGAFYDLREQSREDVKKIIEETAAKQNLTPNSDEQRVADLYRSYMDIDTLNTLGVSPLAPRLADINAIKSKDELLVFFAESDVKGGGSPFGFYVDIDAKDSTRYAAHIWQSGLSLPDKDYYLNDAERFKKIRQDYVKHIENMFTLAGFDQPATSAETILKLETAVAAAQWDVVETRDSTKSYNKYQRSDLPKLADINWNLYLTAVGASDQSSIIINQPSFIQKVDSLIKDTDLETWKTYLRWHLLTEAASNLSAPLAEENFNFYAKTLNGQAEQEPRWKRGVTRVNSLLGEAVGKEYVERHFPEQAKVRMEALVENLRAAYSDSIDNLDWMGSETKVAAKAKLAKFNPKIGYPNKWEDYSQLTIKADDLYGNVLRAKQLENKKQLAKLNSPIDRDEWHMTPQTVNAYYNPTMNEIVFPAAILQPPFFNMEADDAVNYGGIGAVIGHEMGHGFDDQGAKFDGDGNLRNWWTEQDITEFSARTKALIEQYDNYYVFDDLHINGALTLGENIGDLSGATIAYKAYKKSLNGKPAPVIDGLTGDQRFFIGFTQIWRAKAKEESLRNQVATDPHSPSMYRAIGTLSNVPEFYEAFDVKPDDKMYIAPEKRVKIW